MTDISYDKLSREDQRIKQEFVQVNLTLLLEKRQGAFIRAGTFSRINMVYYKLITMYALFKLPVVKEEEIYIYIFYFLFIFLHYAP